MKHARFWQRHIKEMQAWRDSDSEFEAVTGSDVVNPSEFLSLNAAGGHSMQFLISIERQE